MRKRENLAQPNDDKGALREPLKRPTSAVSHARRQPINLPKTMNDKPASESPEVVTSKGIGSSALLASVELHVCRWAFIYVLISYAAFVLCDQFWLNWRWPNGDTVYDVAMCVIGFFWLGIIGLSKFLLSLANAGDVPDARHPRL